MAGTPGNRTQLPGRTGDNGFEGRGEHQPLNHSQNIFLFIISNWSDFILVSPSADTIHGNQYLIFSLCPSRPAPPLF